MEQPTRQRGKSSGDRVAVSVTIDPALHQKIAERAYALFLARHWEHGHDVEDWLEAERLVLGEMKAKTKKSTRHHTGRPRTMAGTERRGRA